MALLLPRDLCNDLASLRIPNSEGVKRKNLDSFHVTLHFIGDADLRTAENLLERVELPSFDLRLQGVGQLASKNGESTLTAFASQSDELMRIHEVVAHVLSPIGFRAEDRPYLPHISLARCSKAVPSLMIDEFLKANQSYGPAPVTIAAFGLFSSDFSGDEPIYRLERSFPLRRK